MKRRYRTGDQAWVREHNLAIVLNYVWDAGGSISRARLTKISGLNKSTVGSLLAQLESWGFVKEIGMANPSRPGRPGVLIGVNPDAGRLIGVEIGVGFISAVLTDMKANVIWRRLSETGDDGKPLEEASQAQVLGQVERILQEAIEQASACGCPLFGIGIGVPGLVDHSTGTLLFAPNLRWSDVPLRDMWQHRFGARVMIDNDANTAALGERMFGVARHVDNFIYLNAGVGLGGGLVIDGRLCIGDGGFAGEVGHMTIEPDGPQCNCGNRGCWEVLISPSAVVQQVRRAVAAGQVPGLSARCGGDVSVIQMGHVLQAAAQGEPAVLAILDEVGRYLGIGVANLVNVFNPSSVILGGILSLAGPYILPRARQEMSARVMAAVRRDVEITLSAFKFDACVMGGVALVVREILSNPTAWQPKPAPLFSYEDQRMAVSNIL